MKSYHADSTRELWYQHHAEQMQAVRSDFQKWWGPIRRRLLAGDMTLWTLARLEERNWERFLKWKHIDEKPKHL